MQDLPLPISTFNLRVTPKLVEIGAGGNGLLESEFEKKIYKATMLISKS
jgi:hypothetical protein